MSQNCDNSWNWPTIASTLGLRAGVKQAEEFLLMEKDASREALSICRKKGEILTSLTLMEISENH